MIRKNIKKSIHTINENRYHRTLNKNAFKAIENIKKVSNYTLTSEQKSKCDNYAHDVLGSRKYAPWLYVYTVFNQEFREGWIPDNYFGLVVAPEINNHLGRIANTKTLTNKLINSDLLPDIVYKVGDNFYNENYMPILSSQLKEYLFSRGNEYYVKLDDSNQGKGVFLIDKEKYNLEHLLGLGNFVIQRPIIQNAFFDEIVEGNGATLRITTIRNAKKEINTQTAMLRLGREKSKIVKSSDSIRVPVSVKDGKLNYFGVDSTWQRHEDHPDNNYSFYNKKIPYFLKSIKALEEIHKSFIHFSVIGWDISIDENGEPNIIEWNAGHPDIKYSEAAVGPCFNDLEWEKLWKN